MLGQEGQQVLVKRGSKYVRVHPCTLQIVEGKTSSCNNDLVQEIDEIELEKINPSTFVIQTNIQVVQLNLKMTIK